MQCPHCQSANPDESRYCGKCGTELPSLEKITLYRTLTILSKADEPVIGELFAQRYVVIDELGRGGMGRVFKALDKEISENIALKVLKPEISSDGQMIERFRNELKLSRRISHPNVCRLYDLNKQGETYFISMEYISGQDLSVLIKKEGPFTIARAITVTRQICEGLAQAHSLGVVHRDLKPHNIMIDSKGNAHIMDFGIARSVRAEGLTQTGVIIGTPEYMSPEQLEGKNADHRSDIYSLGVILYEMLTGRVPFAGDNPFEVALKHKTEAPENPRRLNPQIPENVSRIIFRCLEKERAKRFPTTADLLADLRKIERDILTGEELAPAVTAKLENRRKHLLLRISVLFLALVTLAYVFYHQFLSPRKSGADDKPNLVTEQIVPGPAQAPPQEGNLEITSIPSGADVYLNDKHEGITPLQRRLKPGSYRIKIRKDPEYGEVMESLEVKPGETSSQDYTLVALKSANVKIDSSPRGAEIYVAGEIKGQTPLEFGLEAGTHEVKIRKGPEYKEVTDRWEIKKEELFTRTYALSPVYILEIETIPEGADVRVDSEYRGKAPAEIELSKNRCQLTIENGDQWIKIDEPLFLNPGRNLIRRSLVKIKHSLFIETNPPRANVSINGIPVGVSPVKKMDLSGDCNIRIEKDGYAAISDTIKVESDVEKAYDLIKIEQKPSASRNPVQIHFENTVLEFVETWSDVGLNEGDAFAPVNIAVDNSGRILVTDKTSKSIHEFSSDGKYVKKWIFQTLLDGKSISPYGIAIDKSGLVYVSDIDNHRIVKFDEDGNVSAKWEAYGKGDRSLLKMFRNPTGIAVDHSGYLYVCDTGNNRVVKLSSTGEVIGNLGSGGEGTGQFLRPSGIAVDNNGIIYISDRGNRRVEIFSSSGKLIGEFGGRLGISGLEMKSPSGIAVDNLGYVYVTDSRNHKIYKINVFGSLVAEQGSYGKGGGQFDYPNGIAVDNLGYAYIADTLNNRIQKFKIK